MNAIELQANLWKILGKPEKLPKNAGSLQGGKRIGASIGRYVYAVGGGDGGVSEDEQAPENPEKEGGKDDDNGDDANDPRKNPTQTPKQGESITGLTDLHDCSTGRGVNVNFTIPPKAPDGWEDVCKPPSEPADPKYVFRMSLVLNPYYGNEAKREAEFYLASKKQIASKIIAWYGADKDVDVNNNGGAGTDISAYIQNYMSTYTNGIATPLGNYRLRPKSDANKGYWWGNPSAYARIESIDKNKVPAGKEVEQPAKETWDKGKAAEVVSTPTGFAAACGDDIDPNLPMVFKGGQQPTGFALCDKDGNEVVIERTSDGGWQYSTTTQTIRLDKNGKVVEVVKK